MGNDRSKPFPEGRTAASGFTLLELLVVLAILGIVGAVVAPALGNRSGTELKAAGRLLAAGLRQARSRAMTRNHSVALTVDLARGRIGLAEENRYRRLPRDFEYKLLTARSERVSDEVGRVRFYPDGSSTGGRITVTSGERRLLIDVEWFTGRVRTLDGRDFRFPDEEPGWAR